MERFNSVQMELLRASVAMIAKRDFDHLLYISDLPLSDEIVRIKGVAKKKLVQAVSSEVQRHVIEAMGIKTLSMPIYDIARAERFKIAIVGGIAKGMFRDKEVVLGLVGRGPACYPDTMMIVTIGGDSDDGVSTGFGVIGTDRIPSTILESVIDLAVDIARDGWEGHPLGTILVIGDTSKVLEKSRQLTLNPFQGYSESEKNILNPEVRDAIKSFAVLDGAFVIREDGVVLSAGRYLKFDEELKVEVPLGLGSRHMAGAGISQATDAIALVVSETSRTTRVFQKGRCVLEIHPEQRQRRGSLIGTSPKTVNQIVAPNIKAEQEVGHDGESRAKESRGREARPVHKK